MHRKKVKWFSTDYDNAAHFLLMRLFIAPQYMLYFKKNATIDNNAEVLLMQGSSTHIFWVALIASPYGQTKCTSPEGSGAKKKDIAETHQHLLTK